MPRTETSVAEVYHDTAAALAIAVLANVPVILWGPPGQGKSSVIADMCAGYGFHLETVLVSIREPADFAGLPVVDTTTGTVRFAPPSWAMNLANLGGETIGVQFFDELSTAAPAVQAAAMRPILDKVVGDLTLPSEVRTIAAANPAAVAAGGWELEPPLANRFCHLQWDLPAEVVRQGFTTGWPKVPFPTSVDHEAVKVTTADTFIVLGAFLGARPELVTQIPGSADEAGRAFPTPRSWDMAARLYGAGHACGVSENTLRLLVTGCVGVAAAAEFLNYLRELDLPDPEDILADPQGWDVPADRGDKIYAIGAAVHAAVANNLTAERWVAQGDVIATIAAAGYVDIAFAFGREWRTTRPEGARPSAALVAALGPLVQEIGLG